MHWPNGFLAAGFLTPPLPSPLICVKAGLLSYFLVLAMIHITKSEKLLNWLEKISDLLCKNSILLHENQGLNPLTLEMSLWFICRKKRNLI